MDIREQDQAYKRGLVLGLTMAEVVILILFCLLLTLAAVFASHRSHIAAQKAQIALQENKIAALERAAKVDPEDLHVVSVLKEYWERYGPDDVNRNDYFRQLVLQVEELKQLRSQLEELTERTRTLDEENRKLGERARRTEEIAAERDKARDKIAALETALSGSQQEQVAMKRQLAQLKAEQNGPGEHNWPPIITLSEAERYNFKSGSAELTDSFRQQLKTKVASDLLEIVRKFDVDVIEVVGHTDEQPVTAHASNLDSALRHVLQGTMPIGELTPADNAGLGIARAVSVARVLAEIPALSKLTILPLSGGQLIEADRMTTWMHGGDVPARRRIEIRVRRSSVQINRQVHTDLTEREE